MSTHTSLIRISELLAIYSQQVKILNFNQELGINTHSENILLKILNIIFDSNLINANSIKSNFPAVDLIDTKKRIAFQITSSNQSSKIEHTLEQFKKYRDDEFLKEIDFIYVYITTERLAKYDQTKITNLVDNNIEFNVEKHIVDKRDLYAILKNLNDIEKIEDVLSCLEKEISGKNFKKYIKIGFSFSDADWDFVKPIIKEISLKNIVYSISEKLKDEICEFNDNVLLENKNFSEIVDFCIVIITPNYHKSNWNNRYKCQVLSNSIKVQSNILPFKFKNTASIKELKSKAVIIQENDYDHVIKSLSEQIEIYDEHIIREYKDINKIIDLYKPNEAFRSIKKEKIPSQKIGYEIFESIDPIFKKSEYILYLQENIAQQKTRDHINELHPKVFKDNNLLILMMRPKKLKTPESIKQNIQKIFNPISIYFIDEFVWQFCTTPEFRTQPIKYNLSSFVDPILQDRYGNIVPYESITKWLELEQSPILVLLGSGGIGKTTLAQRISDQISENRPSTKIIFVNAPKIVEILMRNAQDDDESINLYKFYEASHDSYRTGSIKINNESFRINVDNGNILLIIDGIDEIISRAGKYFNVNDFIQSVYETNNEVGNGKVIMTCRDYFWNTSNDVDDKFDKFEILPFNEDKAEIFFNRKFENHSKKKNIVNKGIETAKLILGGNSSEFLPFVLEQVVYMIDEGLEENILKDETFNSEILNKDIKNDYILYKICAREEIRLGQIYVDKQVHFFINFTLSTSKDDITSILDKTFDESLDHILVDKFKAHPLFNTINGYTSFKYDFFDSHFRNIYLGEFLNGNLELNSDLISILADKIKYNNSFVKDVVERINNNVDWKFSIMSSIEGIISRTNIPEKTKRKAISGLFVIALQKVHLSINTIITNTEILNLLFAESGVINNLSINNIAAVENKKIVFDFCGIRLHNCYFNNYDYFWDCKFDDKTIFEDCFFYNLGENYKEVNLSDKNFLNPTNDDSLSVVLKKTKQKNFDVKQKAIDNLRSLIHILCKNGYCGHEPVDKIKKVCDHNIVDCLDGMLIEVYIRSGKKFCEIKSEYKNSVLSYYKDGTMSNIINNAILKIVEELK